VDFRFDYNRDSLVDGSDLAITRDNSTNFLTALKLITLPGGGGGGAVTITTAMPPDVPSTRQLLLAPAALPVPTKADVLQVAGIVPDSTVPLDKQSSAEADQQTLSAVLAVFELLGSSPADEPPPVAASSSHPPLQSVSDDGLLSQLDEQLLEKLAAGIPHAGW